MNVGEAKQITEVVVEQESLTLRAEMTSAEPEVCEVARSATPSSKRDKVAAFSCAMWEVAAKEEVDEAPAAPDEIATPVIGSAGTVEKFSDGPGPVQTPTATGVVPGSAEENAALRLTTMAVLVGQRRCITRMTNAGMQSGPRRNENGPIYLELNNACADEYRNSY